MKQRLTIETLKYEATTFSENESNYIGKELYGVTDGKAVGTYLEHKFRNHLIQHYSFEQGNSAQGIDFPELGVDMKVTSIKQPQSSCPFKSARQKIYGLGYSLLLFVYDKHDDTSRETSQLTILHTVFIHANRTADYQLTRIINETIERDGNADDLVALMLERNLPISDIEAPKLADEILSTPPLQGYLTISNALQWRLQYSRVVGIVGTAEGVERLYGQSQ